MKVANIIESLEDFNIEVKRLTVFLEKFFADLFA